ncbi:hypothetical protein BKA66DRAFT_609988 [Pyrenochaeta sp. MPI-SDFR-AT-0127]|nr:hypothetical protein BKA66DRAFT_609988 [Pyrenochaeta sp. MPI-SDFR-AT-0127]
MVGRQGKKGVPLQIGVSEVRSEERRDSNSISTGYVAVRASEEISSLDTQEKSRHQSAKGGVIPHWTTIGLIFGVFVVALILAIGHFLFFRVLDGTSAEHRQIEQSQVTAISLLITLAFKACLITAVGVSFTQHLWHVVRSKPLRVARIEQLFCLRSNPLEFARVRVILDAPLLFLMGLSVWLIPIAVIYPPSALTVVSRPYSQVVGVNMSVMNPPLPPALDVLRPEDTPFSSLATLNKATIATNGGITEIFDKYDGKVASVRYGYVAPIRPLLTLAKLVLLSGEIIDMPSPEGQNSSYSLGFRAPQLSCQETITNSTVSGTLYDSRLVFNSTWNRESSLTITQTEQFGWYPMANYTSPLNATFTFPIQTKALDCNPISVQYNVDISYVKGIRDIQYTRKDPQPLNFTDMAWYTFPWSETRKANITDVPVDTPEFKAWEAKVKEDISTWNMFALLDASMPSLEYNWNQTGKFWVKKTNFTLSNGTQVEGSPWQAVVGVDKNYPTILETSIFNPQRYNSSRYANSLSGLDPRTDLVFNQASLNDFLANVTISALSLDTWKEFRPINTTNYRATYKFSKPLNLIVPYVLSLAFTLVFTGIGTWSLLQNGVSATDGGFLHVVAATTGRTEMERVIVEHHVTGESVPKEVLNMKIRYGELVDGEGVGTGRAGFGMLEETRPLKRGRSAR